MKETCAKALLLGLGLALLPARASGQGLAEFDYENLSFRGLSLEWGYIWPTRVDPTYTLGGRVDLGYLGPGLRLVPGVTYWSSTMKDSEVRELERKLQSLVDPTSSADLVDLGEIQWSDLALTLDGHFVWSIPFNLLSYLGAGFSAHFMNGDGPSISGTFVEDLLDTVAFGLDFHAGLEYPLSDLFRLYAMGRYEILEDLRYLGVRTGVQIMLGPSLPGEGR